MSTIKSADPNSLLSHHPTSSISHQGHTRTPPSLIPQNSPPHSSLPHVLDPQAYSTRCFAGCSVNLYENRPEKYFRLGPTSSLCLWDGDLFYACSGMPLRSRPPIVNMAARGRLRPKQKQKVAGCVGDVTYGGDFCICCFCYTCE